MKDTYEMIQMHTKYQELQKKNTDANLTEKHEAVCSVLQWVIKLDQEERVKEVMHWIAELEMRRDPIKMQYLSDARETQLRVLYWVMDIDGLEVKMDKVRRTADTVVKHSASLYANTVIFGKKVASRVKETATMFAPETLL